MQLGPWGHMPFRILRTSGVLRTLALCNPIVQHHKGNRDHQAQGLATHGQPMGNPWATHGQAHTKPMASPWQTNGKPAKPLRPPPPPPRQTPESHPVGAAEVRTGPSRTAPSTWRWWPLCCTTCRWRLGGRCCGRPGAWRGKCWSWRTCQA